MSEIHTQNRAIDATSPRKPIQLNVSMVDMVVALVGCLIMAATGAAVGAYLLLPFGATG